MYSLFHKSSSLSPRLRCRYDETSHFWQSVRSTSWHFVLSSSEEWNATSTTEPPSDLEHRPPALRVTNHQVIAPWVMRHFWWRHRSTSLAFQRQVQCLSCQMVKKCKVIYIMANLSKCDWAVKVGLFTWRVARL